jgi:hypothetical protein
MAISKDLLSNPHLVEVAVAPNVANHRAIIGFSSSRAPYSSRVDSRRVTIYSSHFLQTVLNLISTTSIGTHLTRSEIEDSNKHDTRCQQYEQRK